MTKIRIITGTNGMDFLFGRLGDDRISGRGGDDTIFGPGRQRPPPRRERFRQPFRRRRQDWLFGGTQNDNLYGDAATTSCTATAGLRTVKGSDLGADNLSGGSGDDIALPERRQRHRDRRRRQ